MTRRKMLAAEEDIANQVVDLANRKGLTVFQTLNDILEQALRVDGMGLTLEDVIEKRVVLERARGTGLTFTVEHLLYDVVDMAYDEAGEKLSAMWREMGNWYGKYLQSKTDRPVEAFEEVMELLTFGTSEFSLERGREGNLSVSCVGERYTKGFTEVLSQFIEAALEALGYGRKEKETSKGIIRIRFEKSG